MDFEIIQKHLGDLKFNEKQHDIVGTYIYQQYRLAKNQRNVLLGLAVIVASILVLKMLMSNSEKNSLFNSVETIINFVSYAVVAVSIVSFLLNQLALHLASKRLESHDFSKEELVRVRALGEKVLRFVWLGRWGFRDRNT